MTTDRYASVAPDPAPAAHQAVAVNHIPGPCDAGTSRVDREDASVRRLEIAQGCQRDVQRPAREREARPGVVVLRIAAYSHRPTPLDLPGVEVETVGEHSAATVVRCSHEHAV